MASKKADIFTKFTTSVSMALGQPWIFVVALVILLFWGASGPFLGFSDTWQLIVNTSTTIITFLMVFIIQNTQNRDNLAMNIKLDAIMKNLGIQEKELFKAEDESDKRLEQKKESIQSKKRAGSSRKKPTRKG